jgi:RNA polymerase sigma-70 factor (ECF subfamily)
MTSPDRPNPEKDVMPEAASLLKAASRGSARASSAAARQEGRAPERAGEEEREGGTHADDVERVRRASGDGRVFEEIYRQYRSAVFKVAFGVTGNVEDALDVTQEAFLKAHRSLKLFEGRASLLTWLCQIAVHQAIDLGRRKKVRRGVELEECLVLASGRPGSQPAPGAVDPASLAAGNELKDALERALGELSEKHREVFLLYTNKGLSYQEIAEALRISIGTVMSRLFYARKNLQGLLAEFAS